MINRQSFLNGNTIATISMTQDTPLSFADTIVGFPLDRPTVFALTVSLFVTDCPIDASGWFGQRLIGLGEGKQCPYCDVYCIAGVFRCHRCNGLLGRERLLTPVEFPFICKASSISGSVSGCVLQDIEFQGDHWSVEVYNFLNSAKFGITGISQEITLDLDCFLCEWCGMATKGSDTCHGCGGGKIPLSEIVNMDRACLYCDNDRAFNGVFCMKCGARLRGEKLGDWL